MEVNELDKEAVIAFVAIPKYHIKIGVNGMVRVSQ